MIVKHKITMDLARLTTPCIEAMQDDRYSRDLLIRLKANAKPFCPPEACTLEVRFSKSDGTSGRYDTMPDGTPAYDLSGDKLTVRLAPQVLTAAGDVTLTVALLHQDTELSCFPIRIQVLPRPNCSIQSRDYINVTRFLPQPNHAAKGMYLCVEAVDSQGRVAAVTATKGSSPVTSVNGKTGAVQISVPTKTSELTNDSGFLTDAPTLAVRVSLSNGVYSLVGSTYAELLAAVEANKDVQLYFPLSVNQTRFYCLTYKRIQNGVNQLVFSMSSDNILDRIIISEDNSVTREQGTLVTSARKINGKKLNADVTLTAADVGALVADDVSTHIRPYEWGLSATSVTQWPTVFDLPANMFYRFNADVPESFGLPVTGYPGTLVVYNTDNSTKVWYKAFICSVLIGKEFKVYFAYADTMNNLVWKDMPFDADQKILNAISQLQGLVLGVNRPKIVLLGDSITAGVGSSDYSATGELVINKTFGDGNTFEVYRNTGVNSWAARFKAHMESTYPSCTVLNNGVPGFTTWQLSDSLDALVPQDADVAIVQIGTNSRNSEDKAALIIEPMHAIIDYLRSRNITPVIMTNTPLLNQTAPNDAHNVRQCILKACTDKGVHCFDVLGEMEFAVNYVGFLASMTMENLMADDLHPNDAGHDMLFHLYKKLLKV